MQHVEVTRTIAATPERLYALISDLPRMGEWSLENNGGKWLRGATGPAIGAKFKGNNSKGFRRWSTIATVVVADEGREFSFDVTAVGMKVARWGYRFEAVDGGTKVTECWDDHRAKVMKVLTGLALNVPDRASHNAVGMEHTLEQLAAAV